MSQTVLVKRSTVSTKQDETAQSKQTSDMYTVSVHNELYALNIKRQESFSANLES